MCSKTANALKHSARLAFLHRQALFLYSSARLISTQTANAEIFAYFGKVLHGAPTKFADFTHNRQKRY